MNGNSSGSFSVAGFGISSVEHLDFATKESVNKQKTVFHYCVRIKTGNYGQGLKKYAVLLSKLKTDSSLYTLSKKEYLICDCI
jgi:hypothetical protein